MARAALLLLQFLFLTLPFNGIKPIFNAGELSSEGFFYASLLYVPVAVLSLLHSKKLSIGVAREVLRSQMYYMLLIVVSIVFSYSTIQQNSYGGRTGVERYFLSVLTYVYYALLTCVMALHAGSVGFERFTRALSIAFCILGYFLVAVSIIELASWFSAPIKELLTSIRSIFAYMPERPDFRLSGVSLEPSFNAFALLACMPWVMLRARETGSLKLKALGVLLLLVTLVSGARTAYVGLALMMAAYCIAMGWARRVLPNGLDGASLVAGCFILGVVVPPLALTLIDADSSVSNVTRSYLMSAAISSGVDDLQGQGFGQVGFYVVQDVSAAIRYSWELMDFYEGDRYGELPPLFSWYARTFGEFGVAGYCAIGLSFAIYAKRLFKSGHSGRDKGLRGTFVVTALLMAQFLAIAFSIESVRIPQFWLTWLFAGMLIHRAAPLSHRLVPFHV